MSTREKTNTKQRKDAPAIWVSPDELKPWKQNPRLNEGAPVATVIESIQRFGFGAPIVARLTNGEIIAGHTRWLAARELKLKRVPVRYLDLSEPEAHLLALKDNRATEQTPWVNDGLRDLLAELDDVDRDFAGWTERELKQLMPRGPKAGRSEDIDVPDLTKETHVCPNCGHKFTA